MTEVFVDTFHWLSLMNPRDTFHQHVLQMSKPPRMVTTQAVQLEVMDAFCDPRYRGLATEFGRQTTADESLVIVPLETDLLNRSVTFFEKHRDKAWSMTDCISFVVMKDRGIADALTRDHHFEQA